MDKMKFETTSLVDKNIDKIEQIFPGVVTEVKDADGTIRKAVDFEALKAELSKDIVEGRECYEFTWAGKNEAKYEAAKPIRKTLRPCKEESKNWDTTQNLYIEGDNLDVLKLLQESYLGKIKMIYIDPPYNTGNDFVYADDFRMKEKEYEDLLDLTDEEGNRMIRNTDSNGRFHSDWCSMIYSRLKLARNLLSEDGVIFISIDDNEIANLKKICIEIFGQDCFVGQISLLCNPKGRSQDKYIASCHEYVLIFSKSILPSGSVSIPKSADEIKKDYPLFDAERKPYRELELRNTHRDFGKFNRPKLWYPIYALPNGKVSLEPTPESEEVFPIWEDGFEGCWTWGKEKAINDIDFLVAKRISGKAKIYRKSYAYDDGNLALKQVKSIWNDSAFFTEKGQVTFNSLFDSKEKIFQSPKSVSLLRQCILMARKKDMTILDFFSGSATTAHAVMQLNAEDGGNRKFIMVQLPEKCDENSEAKRAGFDNICEIGKERIRRAGEKIKQEYGEKAENLDIGFRVFKLDSTNMKDVYYTPAELTQDLLAKTESNIKDGRTDMDLLYGCLLDWGLELSMPHETKQIDGVAVHYVNQTDLIACFNTDVSEAVIRKIAADKPLRVVFRDSCFKNVSDKTNINELFKAISPETQIKVI